MTQDKPESKWTPEYRREYNRKWCQDNKERKKIYQKEWYGRNPHYQRDYQRKYREEKDREVLEFLNQKS